MAKSRLTEVEEIFDRKLKKLRTPQQWETALKATSNFWKITFCEAMLLLEQLPKAKVCATYEVWNKVGRYVKRGERSAAVFTSRQDTKLKYLFDISQTKGKAITPKWKMTEAIADGIVGKYNSENPETVESFEEYLQKVLDKKLVMLYNYNSKLYANITADPRTAALIAESIRCIVMTRCGIDEKYSFAAITELNIQPAILVELGNTATEIAKELLTDIDRIIRRKEYEQYSNLRRGHLRYPLRGEERTSLPHIQESGTGGAVDMGEKGSRSDSGDGQNGTRPHQYERTLPHDMGGDSSSVRGGIQLDGGDNEKEISPNGELGTAGTAERGDILGSESSEVGLPQSSGEMADSSLLGTGGTVGDKEDNPDINDSSLTEDTTEYDEAEFDEEADSAFYYPDEDDEPLQMSLFGEDEPKQNTPDPNYSFFISKPRYEVRDENIGTHTRRELLLDEIMRGSGVQDGKFRIEQFYKDNNPSVDELATMMKKEYGIGGHSGDGDIGYADHDGSGIKITLDVNDENLIVKYSWTEAARCAAELMKAGQYITQKDIDNRIHNAKFHLRNGYGRPFDSFYYENAVKTLALYNIPLDEVLGVEGMSELNDMFYQLYDDKCAILEQPTTSTPYPVENARANIQAAIDLNKLNINKYINYILVEQRHYPSMQELIDGELYALDFNDLTAYTDEQLEYALSKTYGERSQEELQMFNEEDKLVLYGETALLPDELEGKWHIVGIFEHNDEHLFILESESYGLQNGYAVVDCEENVVAQNIRSVSEIYSELPPMLIRVTAEYAYDMWEHGFSVFFPDGSPAAPYVPNMHDSGISNALSQLDDYIMSAYPEDIWKMWDRSRLIDKLDNLNDHIIWYSVDHSIDEYHYLELENFIDDYGYEEQTGENQYSWREGWTVWQNIDIMLSQGKIPPLYEWLHDVTNDFEGILEVDFAEVSKALAEYIGKHHPEYNFEPIETENEPER